MAKCPVCGYHNTADVEFNNERAGVRIPYEDTVLSYMVPTQVCLHCGVMFISRDDCKTLREAQKRGVQIG